MQLRLSHFILSLVTLFALVACDSSEPTPTTAPTPDATPIPAVVYRVAAEFDAITLDPAVANGLEDRWASGELLFNQLFDFDETGALQPELAQRLPEISADGLTLTLTLRSGVQFHNGQTLTAEDVKFTLERVLQPATGSWGVPELLVIAGADAVAAGTTASLNGIIVLDPQTLRITLTRPSASFIATLSASAYSIVPREAVQAAGPRWGREVVIGSGPFRLGEWTAGQFLTLHKNEAYFKTGLPKLDAVEIAFNVVPFVGIERLTAQQTDFVSLTSSDELLRQRDTHGVKVLTTTSTIGTRIVFNPNNEAVRDVRVRKAVATAINKAALLRRLGVGQLAQGILPPALPEADTSFTSALAFDRERAREFLLEAGYPNGIARWLILSDESREQIEVIQADLRNIGIESEVLNSGSEGVLDKLATGEIAFTYQSSALPVADAYEAVKLARVGCGLGVPMGCAAEVDALLVQAEQLPFDSPQRATLYRQMQRRIVDDDVLVVPVLWKDVAGLSRGDFAGDTLHPVYLLPRLEAAAAKVN